MSATTTGPPSTLDVAATASDLGVPSGNRTFIRPGVCRMCDGDTGHKSCGRCGLEWYCSFTCQRAGWISHKLHCKMLLEMRLQIYGREWPSSSLSPLFNYKERMKGSSRRWHFATHPEPVRRIAVAVMSHPQFDIRAPLFPQRWSELTPRLPVVARFFHSETPVEFTTFLLQSLCDVARPQLTPQLVNDVDWFGLVNCERTGVQFATCLPVDLLASRGERCPIQGLGSNEQVDVLEKEPIVPLFMRLLGNIQMLRVYKDHMSRLLTALSTRPDGDELLAWSPPCHCGCSPLSAYRLVLQKFGAPTSVRTQLEALYGETVRISRARRTLLESTLSQLEIPRELVRLTVALFPIHESPVPVVVVSDSEKSHFFDRM